MASSEDTAFSPDEKILQDMDFVYSTEEVHLGLSRRPPLGLRKAGQRCARADGLPASYQNGEICIGGMKVYRP